LLEVRNNNSAGAAEIGIGVVRCIRLIGAKVYSSCKVAFAAIAPIISLSSIS
jgi:hypothetical protein